MDVATRRCVLAVALVLLRYLPCEGDQGETSSPPLHFTHLVYNASIYENSAPKTYVESYVKMGIYLADPQWAVRYRIASGDPAGIFKTEEHVVGDFCFLRIRTKSGNTAILNREVKESYTLLIQATEKTSELEASTHVRIQILDRNDLKPLFSPPSYRVTIPDNTPPKRTICTVSATDADLGQNAGFYYAFNPRSELFAVHPTSGAVTVTGKLSAIHRGRHELRVLAVDRMRKIAEGNGFGNLASLVVQVEAALRKPPAIKSITVVDSDLAYATLVVEAGDAEVSAVDIVEGDPGKHFRVVEPAVGSDKFTVVSVREINWMEHSSGFNLSLRARDGSKPPLYSQIQRVHFPPSKLISARFDQDVYRVRLSEFSPPGSRVVMVSISPVFPNLRYVLQPTSDSTGFQLNAHTGLITTTKPLDFHERSHYKLAIGTSPGQTSTTVFVDIVDCNNHAPMFSQSSYHGTFDENISPGTSVLTVTATDNDSGENGFVTYSIAYPKSVPFSIDPYSGIISTSKLMDYELMQRLYHFQVWASDWGSPFRQETEVSISLMLNNLNDNSPMFEKANCSGTIPRDLQVGEQVATMSAIDRDELQSLKYEIVSGNELQYFDLNHFSGVITLRRTLQGPAGAQPHFSLQITASDGEHNALPTTLNVTVAAPGSPVLMRCEETGVLRHLTETIIHSIRSQVQEANSEEYTSLSTYQINRHGPQFEESFPRSIDVMENVPVNSTIAHLTATDHDSGFNGMLVYSLAEGNEASCFDIDLETGLLRVVAPLDHEASSFYVLNVTVHDLGIPQKSSWKQLAVNVGDANDNVPRFPPGGYRVRIPEDTQPGTTVMRLRADDADKEDNGKVRYALLTPSDKFSVHAVTGELVVTGSLDRESWPRYVLTVEARDQPTVDPQLFSVTDVVVTLEDVNDNSPRCIPQLNRLKVPEDAPPGTLVLFLEAFDPDAGPGGEVKYALVDNAQGTFQVDKWTGAVTLERELNFETRALYNLTVEASDGGKPLSRSSTCYVEVSVLDVNENLHPPHFASFVSRGSVQENSPRGTLVMTAAAQDPDPGRDGELQYFLREGTGLATFSIDHETGTIRTVGPLDRERTPHYWLTVLAVDLGSVPLSAVTEVFIEVTDVNDNPPQMSRPVFYPSVREDAPLNTSVLQLDAWDQDSSSKGKLTFHIISGNQHGNFAIDPITGLLSTSRQLDRENKAEHILEVAVMDNGEPGLQSTSRVVIQVLDVNDNHPAFSHKLFKVRLPERSNGRVFEPLYRLVASDRDEGPNGQITYSLEENDEGNFSIHPTTGVVYSSRVFPIGEYNILTVKATDGGRPPLSSSVRLHIEWIPWPGPSSEVLAFDEPHFNFAVMETDPVNHMVGVISTEVQSGLLWFNISGGDEDMDFDIEKTTGSMAIARRLDARKRSSYNLTVQVTDGSSVISTQTYIHVISINQYRPQFLEDQYEVKVPQDTPPGVEIIRVSATDKDKGKGLIYTLHGSADPRSTRLFQLDPGSGTLVTVGKLDLDSGPSQHILTIMVRDQEVPIKRNFVWVTIRVEDSNAHPPHFASLHYEATTLDSAAPGTEVLQVRALVEDHGVSSAQVHYSIQAGNDESFFSIDQLSGVITVARKLNQSKQDGFSLTVQATDGSAPQLQDSTVVNIHIAPSDHTPPRFSKEEYFVEIRESAAIGSPLTLVSATSLSAITYEVREGDKDGVFAVNAYSGLISTRKSLDYEKITSYQLKIRGINMAGAFADAAVLIYVIDENDHAPAFTQPTFVGYISEAAPEHSLVMGPEHSPLVVRATDADQDANALLVYEIREPEALKYFAIDESMGTLTMVAEVDYEQTSSFHFSVHVRDQGNPVLFSPEPAKVTVVVRDVNDCPPVFSEAVYALTALLPVHRGMELLKVLANDADSPVTYSITGGNADHALAIHPHSGLISVNDATQLGGSRELTVRAGDGFYKSTALVRVNLTEAPITSLRFDRDEYTAAVKENSGVAQALVILGVQGSQLNDTLSFSALNGRELFEMIRSVGVLRTRGLVFDREQQETHEVAVEVRDNRSPPRVARATVRVRVEDANDNRPTFENLPYFTSVPEGTDPGDVVFQVSATDRDLGANGTVTYGFAEDYQYFRIDPYLGDISLRKPLDYRALNKYLLKVIARDGGDPPLQTEGEVLVLLRNKSNPLFQSLRYRVKVPENIPLFTPILHTQARSPEGLRLIYNIMEEESLALFMADFKTGVLSVIGPLDYEAKAEHVFTVRATDTALGSFSEATVHVEVEDINDNPPVFSQTVYTASVSEGLPAHTPVIRLLAADRDSGRNGAVSYQIVEDGSDASEFFQVDGRTGQMATARELDYELRRQFRVKVSAADDGEPALSSEALVVVQVVDVNDNPPEFRQPQYEANVSELATCGHLVLKVQALDPDSGETTRLEYLILSGNEDRHFTINSSSGIISMFNLCRRHLDPAYRLRVAASDGVFRSTVPVYINTTNANKYSPAFDQHVYEAELAENAMAGTKVIELLAVDPDDGPYGTVDYIIINKLASEKFAVDAKGRITTLQELDRENSTERVIAIKIMARDGGGKVAFCTVKIILTDVNDNPPQFKASEYTVSVQSNVGKGAPVIQVLAYDADEGLNADVTYSVDSLEDLEEEVIEINPATGMVKVRESLIKLENRAFDFNIRARDGGTPQRDSLVPLRLQVAPSGVSLPKFSEPLYTFSASEDLPEGSEIGLVKAVAEEPVIYSLVKGTTPESNQDGAFSLDRDTGALKVNKSVDHETTRWYQLDVMAHCSHQETELVSLVSVNIQVKDVNDNQPVFEADPYKAFLMENMPVGTTVIQVTANDQDTGSDGQVTYSLAAESDWVGELFAIDRESGWITTRKELDCEARETYQFHVVASDHGRTIQLSSQALVEVTVSDENDNAPRFTSEVYRGSVIENSEPGQLIATLRTLDADISEQNRQVACYITEGDPLGQFDIIQADENWKISSKKPLDREDIEKYFLRVTVSDGKFQASTQVEVFVLDINDNSPKCRQILYTGRVAEDVPPGHFILQVSAVDADAGVNAQVTYSLHGPGADEFRLDPYTGELFTLTALDREEKDRYHLVAKATDGGGRSCQADVILGVDDVNDNAPRFTLSHCSVVVFDNTTVKTPVAVVSARDPDEGPNAQVTYSLTNSADGRFSVEATTGVIRLEKALKDMDHSVLELVVQAADQGDPYPLSTLSTVTVSVVDLTEYLPVFLSPEHVVEVAEGVAVGTEVLQLSLLTREGTEKSGYRIVGGNDHGKFRLNSRTGSLYVNGSLDFEVSHEHYLSIECSRKGASSLSDVMTVVINVTDVNDHEPKFTQELYSTDIREDAAVGETILTLTAVDEDGPMNSNVTYSLVGGDPQGHFAIHPKRGEIHVARPLDWEETPSYHLTVRATDNGQPALWRDGAVSIHVADVNDNPPRFFQLNYSIVVQESAPLGTSVLELTVSDRDSPENGPPYSFRIAERNDGLAFRITQDGVLMTAAVLRRAAKEQYLLQVQVSDSGDPPLWSSAYVHIQVTERSRYPPTALPLEIFIATGEPEFQGGVVGKIHATDQDPNDSLLFNLVEEKPAGHRFSVGPTDGKVVAAAGLPLGRYALNVSVSDGTFAASTGVHVQVWHLRPEALERVVLLRLRHLSPEEFVGDHWRNLQRFLGYLLGLGRQHIHLASLQPSEVPGDVDLLLAFEGSLSSWPEPRGLVDAISQATQDMDRTVGIQVKKVMPAVPCQGLDCQGHPCRETVQLDPGVMSTYSTARLSVLTPRHNVQQICSCNGTAARFSGHSYVQYRHPGTRNWRIQFHLKTRQSHAVLLSVNGTEQLLLELSDGAPHLQYHCPGGFRGNLSSGHLVSDQEWHSVLVEVTRTSVRLLVNGSGNASLPLPEPCGAPFREGLLCLGGVVHLHRPRLVSRAFRGCLDALRVNGEEVGLLPGQRKAGTILEEESIKQCCSHESDCSQNPCLNDGLCLETPIAGYTCVCPKPFSGEHCQLGEGPCTSKPCLHGGTCFPTPRGYTCTCLRPYTGERCEAAVKECQGESCLIIPQIEAAHWGGMGQQEVGVIVGGVLGVVLLVGIFVAVRWRCRPSETHKPVAKEDPDLISKSMGVDTRALPPIELNILGGGGGGGSSNDLDGPEPRKGPALTPEFVTFGPAHGPKHRSMAVCSVAPNLPPPAPPSTSDNESVVKSAWAAEEMVYPAETTYWPPRYHPAELQEYPRYELIQGPLPPSPHRRPPPPIDSEPAGLYGGFPFPLDQSNKRAPIPPRYSNQNLEDFLPPPPPPRPPSPRDRPPVPCQNEYTAISYYPSQFLQGEGPLYPTDLGYKRVSVRLSVAQPSYADGQVGPPPPGGRGQPGAPRHYEGSDMVESDYGSCEEVMF
ncbi:protocadherin Fat 2 [Ornithorhynchus anatinus]|uniref:FAT atypical cadherin 2 n=1 Tax=Ornithorhynchus anatinus TaxID=9258 RepID=F6Y9Z1_ORNAN|nr:protocadherin Fat 2 [Ornithorhynchus anatinus]